MNTITHNRAPSDVSSRSDARPYPTGAVFACLRGRRPFSPDDTPLRAHERGKANMIAIHPGAGERSVMRIHLGDRLDVDEVRRFRERLAASDGPPGAVDLDLSSVRAADGAAILLLDADLGRLERAGARVALRRVPRRLQVQLHLHPILRFASEPDDLFTDPDLEWPGFRHSER